MSARASDGVAVMAADFIALRIARDQAFNTPRKANKFFERAHAVAVRLRATAEGRAALLAILDHEDRGVRLGAAAECTPFAATEATKVFRELIEPRGRHSFDAEMTLKEFEAGRLKMDW